MLTSFRTLSRFHGIEFKLASIFHGIGIFSFSASDAINLLQLQDEILYSYQMILFWPPGRSASRSRQTSRARTVRIPENIASVLMTRLRVWSWAVETLVVQENLDTTSHILRNAARGTYPMARAATLLTYAAEEIVAHASREQEKDQE